MLRRSMLLMSALILSSMISPAIAEDKIDPAKMTKTDSGLKYQDLVVGKKDKPKAGQSCKVHYTGWLWVDGKKGKKFDSSVDRGEKFSFRVGEGQVIKGWDEGVLGMNVGGKRLLLLPPELAYGDNGAGAVIPPSSTLLFEVELFEAE